MPPVAAVSFLSAPTAPPLSPEPLGGGAFQAALAAATPTTATASAPAGIMPALAPVPNTPPSLAAIPALSADVPPPRPEPDTGGSASIPAPLVPVGAQPAADGAMPRQGAGVGLQAKKATPGPDTTASPATLSGDIDAMSAAESVDDPASLAASAPTPTRTPARSPIRFTTPGRVCSEGDPVAAQVAGSASLRPVDPPVLPTMPQGAAASTAPFVTNRLEAMPLPKATATNGIASPGLESVGATGTDRPGLAATSTPPATVAADATATHAPAAFSASLADEARHVAETPSPNPAALPATPVSQQPATIAHAMPAAHRATDAGSARAATIGRDVGVAIARHVDRGGASTVTIRLDPVELGRIEVRLQIDPMGKLLASIAADQPAALDLLRRDSAMLAQTLSQGGVQADASSFSFDTRSGDGGRGGAFAAPARGPGDTGDDSPSAAATPAPPPVTLRTSGRINLVA